MVSVGAPASRRPQVSPSPNSGGSVHGESPAGVRECRRDASAPISSKVLCLKFSPAGALLSALVEQVDSPPRFGRERRVRILQQHFVVINDRSLPTLMFFVIFSGLK